MRKREMLILRWLKNNPGWHTLREIGVQALRLDRTRRWPSDAIEGHLRRLRKSKLVEFDKRGVPGALGAYRAAEVR